MYFLVRIGKIYKQSMIQQLMEHHVIGTCLSSINCHFPLPVKCEKEGKLVLLTCKWMCFCFFNFSVPFYKQTFGK